MIRKTRWCILENVIAENELGVFKIDRLQLEEVITVKNRKRLFNHY